MIDRIGNLVFDDRWFLALIPTLLILGVIWWIARRKVHYASLNISSLTPLLSHKASWKAKLKSVLPLLRIPALALLLVALARPQTTFDEEKVTTEGIDIVLVIDVSTSMLAQDFKPHRLESAKRTALEFIDSRPNDRIGLVIFAGESFTQCPVTIDHTVLKNQLKQVKEGLLEDGTAIGMGLATAVQRLKDSESKSKVVILLTDGVNNKGIIDPTTASEIAMQMGVRVYTVGVGTKGKAYSPVGMYPNGQFVYDYVDVEIDEPLLKKIASKSGGRYFRATNDKALSEVYKEIDQLEKTKIKISAFERKTEKFYPFALAALLLIFAEMFLRYGPLRSLP